MSCRVGMIYTLNITTKARKDDEYSEVSLNRYPIVYISDDSVDTIIKDKDLIDIIKNYIHTDIIYNNSKICIRCINGNLKKDYEFSLDKIYNNQ